jgi:hypothetical protein
MTIELSRSGVGALVNCLKTLTRFRRTVYKLFNYWVRRGLVWKGNGFSEMEMTVLSEQRRSQFQTRFARGMSRLWELGRELEWEMGVFLSTSWRVL